MNKDLEILNNDDVISVVDTSSEGRFILGNTLKVQQLYHEYRKYVRKSDASTSNEEIFEKYIECQVLRQDTNSKGWRKGKIKFVIQFEPEVSPENNQTSLDNIRQQINTTS